MVVNENETEIIVYIYGERYTLLKTGSTTINL